MSKRWQLNSLMAVDSGSLPQYPRVVRQLLAARGLIQPEQIRDFLELAYAKLHNPFLFSDMSKAVERIERALRAGEKICIYADYDADAITAAAVVFLALEQLGIRPDWYIPDRFNEGYGLNADAISQIAEQGGKLLVTVDCGTNAVAEVALAQSLGLDVIVTDHHEITGELPAAYALLNPKNRQDKYPTEVLTGVGVAYKLVQALFSAAPTLRSGQPAVAGWEKWLLDLAALGTVADLQPLTDENRILVHFGLKVLSKTRWPGLRALMQSADLVGSRRGLDTYTLGFILAPRINAAGRIEHGDLAFRLLVTHDPSEAGQLAQRLHELNVRRQMLTEQTLSEARALAETMSDKKVLLVAGENWPKGVVGLVAGKLAEEFNRPVLVIDKTAAVATGSARSVKNFDIVKALAGVAEHLLKFGGHEQAAGFSLATQDIPMLHQKLLEYAANAGFELTEPQLRVDLEIQPPEVNWELLGFLKQMQPFGMGNPKPRFLGRNLQLLRSTLVGAQNQHLKFRCRFGEQEFGAIAFNQAHLDAMLKNANQFDAIFELDDNEWNGNRELQLKIIDLNV